MALSPKTFNTKVSAHLARSPPARRDTLNCDPATNERNRSLERAMHMDNPSTGHINEISKYMK